RRGTHDVRDEHPGELPSSRRVRGQDPEGSKDGRSAGVAAEPDRAGHQLEDREDAGPDDPGIGVAKSGRSDPLMNRRDFLGSAAGSFIAAPLGACAQRSSLLTIGFLSGQSSGPWAPYVAALRNGLNET